MPNPTTKAVTTNPKDLFGAKKVNISLIPPVALLHEAHAMMDGAKKYDPFNWRAKSVQAMIYVAAVLRHIEAWADGEEDARDSGCHHLGHARSCLGILLDAQEYGNLIDDRPKDPNARKVFADVLERLNKKIAERQAAEKAAVEPVKQQEPAKQEEPVGSVESGRWSGPLPNPGLGYRLLQPGEVIKKGDEYFGCTGRWNDSSADAGVKYSGNEGGYFLPRRRRIQPSPLDVAVQPAKS